MHLKTPICIYQSKVLSVIFFNSIYVCSFFSVRSWRSGVGPHRVFVPHSPLDLKIGHRVRIMLPSGRISTGTLRYLGNMHNSPDYHLGVELELADNGQHDGTYDGQRYFDWYDNVSGL